MTDSANQSTEINQTAGVDTTPAVADVTTINTDQQTDAQQIEGMTQAETEAFLEIKYNKETLKLDKDKAIEYAQKGMNYDKVKEKLDALENDPSRSFVEYQAKRYNMTVPQYLDAVRVQEEQDQLDELIDQNIPESIAKEMLENRKFREQYEAKEQESKTKAQQEAEFQAFLEAFPDAKPEDIPQFVWEEHANGKSLVDAYTRHENQTLKEKLAAVEQEKGINAKNAENANLSTGAVNNKGSDNQNQFFNKKQVDAMSQADVDKNWSAIVASMKKPEFYS